MLETAKQQVIFFASMGYRREQVRAHIEDLFPTADFDSLWIEAEAQIAESERSLDAAVARDDKAARAAEHDLTKTMHGRQ